MKNILIVLLVASLLAAVAMVSHGYFEKLRQGGTAGENLIANSALEHPQPKDIKKPYGWQNGHWGENHADFKYLETGGINNSRAVKIWISSYRGGDAKWYFDYIKVRGGQRYRFSDWYKSDANTTVALCTDTENLILNLMVPPAANWSKTETTFTMPLDATRATVFHLLSANGNLTTDNYNFAPVGFEETDRSFRAPLVSLIFIGGDPQKYWAATKTIGMKPYYWKATFYVRPVFALDDGKYSPNGLMIDRIGWFGNEIALDISANDPDRAQKMGTALAIAKTRWQVTGSIAFPPEVQNFSENSLNLSDFTSGLGLENGVNLPSGFDRYGLMSINGDKLDTDDFKKTMDQAIKNKAWLIIRYRGVPPKDHLDWLLANNIDPLPICEALEEIKPQLPD